MNTKLTDTNIKSGLLRFALLAIVGLVMAWFSWGKWPDVLVDFGRELYVPWQLSQGKVLYQDITHLFGPLSQYFNATLFRCFGVSIITLVLVNFALLIILLGLLNSVFSQLSSRLAATFSCLIFLLLFTFNQYGYCGNFNYICPYSHELTHGLILDFIALVIFLRYLKRRRLIYLFACGLTLGLVFLTKTECFIAGEFALLSGIILNGWSERSEKRAIGRELLLYFSGQVVPAVLAFVLLTLAMPPGRALTGLLGSWIFMFKQRSVSSQFYRNIMGVDDLKRNLILLLIESIAYLAILGFAAWASMRWRLTGKKRVGLIVTIFAIPAGLLFFFRYHISWLELLRPLPVLMLSLSLAFGYDLYRHRADRQVAQRRIGQITLVIFAFLMMLKMFLNVHLYHYGFALAMPATLLGICVVFYWIPQLIRKKGVDPLPYLALVSACLLIAIFAHLQLNAMVLKMKRYVVHDQADWFFVEKRGTAVTVAQQEIEKRSRPEQTLAVFPDSPMLNYLSRRRNPTPYINFMPSVMNLYGEDVMLQAYKDNPPDFIAFVNRDTTEDGYAAFGQDFGQKIFSWIKDNYQSIGQIGEMPFVSKRFGILLLQRRTMTNNK